MNSGKRVGYRGYPRNFNTNALIMKAAEFNKPSLTSSRKNHRPFQKQKVICISLRVIIKISFLCRITMYWQQTGEENRENRQQEDLIFIYVTPNCQHCN